MTSDEVVLKPNAIVEPLFNQWPAWSYLVSPVSSALFVANLHVKLMQSFATSPQIHANAVKNPAMRGGPYLHLDASRVPEVKELLERTTKEQAHVLELADAVKTLDRILVEEGKGFSLEQVYKKVPAPLAGFVELVYDLKDNAYARFIEVLLYKSRYYAEKSQSVALSLGSPDDRPFRLSTPRLKSAGDLFVPIPFASPALDALYEARRRPRAFGAIQDALGVTGGDAELLRSFFTTEPPPARHRPPAGPTLRYFGHAGVLFEAPSASVLVDPVVSLDREGEPDRASLSDLPPVIDYVVLTHHHPDHCSLETLLELRHRVRNVVVPQSDGGTPVDTSLRRVLENIGFRSVREITELESMPIEGGAITALPLLGEHGDLDVRAKLAFFVALEGRSALFLADSVNLEPRLYDGLHDWVGDADVLFIGMECEGAPMSWVYGPLFTRPLPRKNDQSRKSGATDADKAMGIVERFKPRQVYVYAMGQEPWLSHVTPVRPTETSRSMQEANKLVERCRAQGMAAERLYLKKEIPL